MKKLLLLMFGLLIYACEPVLAQTPLRDTIISTDRFLGRRNAVNQQFTQDAVRERITHKKTICFRISGADSATVEMTKIFSDVRPDTVTYTLAKTAATGVWTLTTPYNTNFTAGKTSITFSSGQATGKFYFSTTNTSTSVITIYCYLQATDALTNTAFTTNGTFMYVDIFD